MANKENSMGCIKVLFLLSFVWFVLVAVISLFAFMIEGESFAGDFFNTDYGGPSLANLRFSFISVIVTIVIYLILGGSLKNLFKLQ